MNPFLKFEEWYKEELFKTTVSIPSACCLSTIGLDGYPNARFVSFKSLVGEHFIITGPVSSRKGLEIENIPKAALTFWWTETERQVRIQGNVLPLEEEFTDLFFEERNRDAKLISSIFEQGKKIDHEADMFSLFEKAKEENKGREIQRPKSWGGFKINPVRIEFLEFDERRLHSRNLYSKENDSWKPVLLQP